MNGKNMSNKKKNRNDCVVRCWGTRRPRGGRKGGAAAGETGARIGGARAAGSGAAKPPSQPSAGAGRAGDLGRTELWPLRAVHISAGGGGELYIAVPAGRTA